MTKLVIGFFAMMAIVGTADADPTISPVKIGAALLVACIVFLNGVHSLSTRD